MSPLNNLTVIIPTINEETNLSFLLMALKDQEDVKLEVIVADGGSTDQTRETALAHGARFIRAEKGRGGQMNAAAALVDSDFLLFLHADSRIENNCRFLADALRKIITVEKKVNHCRVAGHFRLRFNRDKKGHDFFYRYIEGKTALNRVNTTNGDQGFLLRRDFFRELGGFDQTIHFLEDQKLAELIRLKGRWITLPGVLITSARRFEKEGVWRCYILMSIIMGLYSTGTEAFFKRAQGIYQTQDETGKLMLRPFFSAICKMMRQDLGFLGSLRVCFFVGRYIRENAWQFFYLLDMAVNSIVRRDKHMFLRVYDLFGARIMSFFIFDFFSAILAFFWFMGVLGPIFWLKDGPFRRS